MIILKKIADRSYLNTLTVGEIAKTVLRAIIEGGALTGAITPNDIVSFKDKAWTMGTFGVQYPLLSNTKSVISGGCRYYKDEIDCYGEKLFLTNYWKPAHKGKLIDWIVNWVSKNGIPVRAEACDNDCRWVYYNHNVNNGERIATLAKKLEVEYLEYIYNFAQKIFRQLFGDDFPDPIEVVLCKECPTEKYDHPDEYIRDRINELVKNGETVDLEKTSEILRHTDYITGRFCESPKPHIEIYFKQFLFINFDEDFAQISQVLAHEFMHYMIYAYRKLHTSTSGKSKNVSEALADFFGVLYSVNRANNLNIPNLKAARELAAAMRYDTWVRLNGSGWPYSSALHFYNVNSITMPFSYQFADYASHGSIYKLIEVFAFMPNMRSAYRKLIGI